MNQPISWVKSTLYDGLNINNPIYWVKLTPNVFCPILTQCFLKCKIWLYSFYQVLSQATNIAEVEGSEASNSKTMNLWCPLFFWSWRKSNILLEAHLASLNKAWGPFKQYVRDHVSLPDIDWILVLAFIVFLYRLNSIVWYWLCIFIIFLSHTIIYYLF